VLAVGGENFNARVVGGDVAGVILQPDEPADDAVAGTVVVPVARRGQGGGTRGNIGPGRNVAGDEPNRGNDLDAERLDPFAFLGETGAEVAMVIGRLSGGVSLGGMDEAAGAIEFQSAVRGGEINADADENGVRSAAVVPGGLLRAVAHAVKLRELDHLRKRSVDLDFGYIGTGLGRRKGLKVAGKESSGGFVMALAEEIGFANSFIGEGRLEGKGRLRNEQGRGESCEAGPAGREHRGHSLLLRRLRMVAQFRGALKSRLGRLRTVSHLLRSAPKMEICISLFAGDISGSKVFAKRTLEFRVDAPQNAELFHRLFTVTILR
jgi:hypothetical protein